MKESVYLEILGYLVENLEYTGSVRYPDRIVAERAVSRLSIELMERE